MLVYVMFVVMNAYGGLQTYEFKDKAQCESTLKHIKEKYKYHDNIPLLYCQEVRK